MFFAKVVLALAASAAALLGAAAEKHIISFDNQCGYGTPILRGQNGAILSQGEPYEADGPIGGLISYLQTGSCGANGEGCTLVEATLVNGWSSADISLIPPHAFSATSGFGFWGGCDGAGADCAGADCALAFFKSDDNEVQVGCPDADVNLVITFCH